MEPHAFPAPHSNANVVVLQGLLCMSLSSCSPSCMPCDGDSLEPVTSSLIASPFWLGDAVTPTLPSGMLPLSIRVPCYWAIGCIPCSVAVQDSPSFFSCLLPTSMMLLLLHSCWHGLSASTRSVLALSVSMPPIGACVSLPGFTALWVPLRSSLGIPNVRRIALVYLPPGPKKNSANVAASNALSGASSSSFVFSVHPYVAGLPSPRRSH